MTKFYQTLNQAPRSMKNHGKHRRAGAPAYSRSSDGASYSAGGADPGGADDVTTYSWSTFNHSIDFAVPEPEPPTIPYAGIRTGELIGHRMWWYLRHRDQWHISSLAHRCIWEPGETIVGNTQKPIENWNRYARPIWGGTYAYFRREQMEVEVVSITSQIRGGRPIRARGQNPFFVDANFAVSGLVVGTVKLWGDVVEHEEGYRAEFAKLNSIDDICGEGGLDIEELRQRYGVPAPVPPEREGADNG